MGFIIIVLVFIIYFLIQVNFSIVKVLFGDKGLIIYGTKFYRWEELNGLKWEMGMVKENMLYPEGGFLVFTINNRKERIAVTEEEKQHIEQILFKI